MAQTCQSVAPQQLHGLQVLVWGRGQLDVQKAAFCHFLGECLRAGEVRGLFEARGQEAHESLTAEHFAWLQATVL